jgi:hypothetical protein
LREAYQFLTFWNLIMNMSGNGSLADRLDSLYHQLATNKIRFMGSVLDLENELVKQTQMKQLSWNQTITIEEFSDADGYLNDKNIDEAVWLESLSRETELDCRMIIDFKPVKALGLERWQVMVNENGKPVIYDFKVWFVPVPV